MSQIIWFVLGLVVGVVITQRKNAKNVSPLGKANDAREKAHDEALEKILVLVREKASITNDDVQVLLGVSDATATRYLQELESQGKLAQQGAEGQTVAYTLKS